MSQFGFTVKRATRYDYETGEQEGFWHVALPHQCDYWDIAGEDHHGAEHAEAIAALEQFIAEAQEAMGKLKAQQEMGGES